MFPGLRFTVNRYRMKPYNGFTYDFYTVNDNFGLFPSNFGTKCHISPGIWTYFFISIRQNVPRIAFYRIPFPYEDFSILTFEAIKVICSSFKDPDFDSYCLILSSLTKGNEKITVKHVVLVITRHKSIRIPCHTNTCKSSVNSCISYFFLKFRLFLEIILK